MTTGGEIIGDIAAGALTARAVEPAHGEGKDDGHTHEAACLNCGTALVGSHCHACGQAAHVHRTIGAFFHDLLHGVFHFEGKIWRTIPMLVWQPGKLTREYIDGRRASYVSPIALFLFSVFLMFAVISQFTLPLQDIAKVNVDGKVVQGIDANKAELDKLRAERARLAASGQSTSSIDEEIRGREQGMKVLENLKSEGLVGKEAEQGALNVKTDIPALDTMVRHFRENPGLVIYKIQSNAYKYSWALIPLSVPFVWLLFPFSRRFHLYDHTVFVTYSLCFMTMLVSVLTLGSAWGVPLMAVLAVFVPPMHVFRQLRGTYALGLFSALWRTAALLFIASCALTVFALGIMAQAGA